MSEHPQITPADCVLYKDTNGNIMSCGYMIESELLRQGISPVQIMKEGKQKGKVSDLFADLAVPMGLLCVGSECKGKYASASTLDSDVVDKDLYDRLVELAAVTSGTAPAAPKRTTRRRSGKTSLNKTRHRRQS
jgi:hypothetical protein